MEGIPIIEVVGDNGRQNINAVVTIVGFETILPVIAGHPYSGFRLKMTLPDPLVISDIDARVMGINFSIEASQGFTLDIGIRLDRNTGDTHYFCEATDVATGIKHILPILPELRADMRIQNLRRSLSHCLKGYPESQKYSPQPKPVPVAPPFPKSNIATNLLLLM
jgi:hypothetical protein